MFYYRIYGLTIKTDYEFEEAISIDPIESPDVTIVEDTGHDRIYEIPEEEIDMPGYSYRFEADRGWVRNAQNGAFIVKNGRDVKYKLFAGYDHLLINEYFLCLILPMIIIQRCEQIMVHGSGLLWNDKCFIISGVSGAGKSSVTKQCISNGAKYLADDTVALSVEDEIYAHSAYPQRKLCRDQITDEMKNTCDLVLLPDDEGAKYGVRDRNNFAEGKYKLDAIVILSPKDGITETVIEEITGADKLTTLMANMYRIDAFRVVGMPPYLFKKCIEISNKVKIYKVSRPKQGYWVSQQAELIKNTI